ncbi:peptidoglycan DD-metalloendopeptidase family protein [Pantanalinema rosaneae CENA516]|uniref:M23 family metallopeptidase n=1 Tax=Pantanalinema rosaneae TaxID=1620701 RepID=UPI003D6E95CC
MQAEPPVSPIDMPQAIQQSPAEVNVIPQAPAAPSAATIAPPESFSPPPVQPANTTQANLEPVTVQVSTTNHQEAAIAKERQRLEQQLADIVARDRATQVGQQPSTVIPEPVEVTPEVVTPTPVTVSPFPSSEQVEVRLEPRTPAVVTPPRPRSTPPIAQPPQGRRDQPQPTPPAFSNWNSIDLGVKGDVSTGASNISPPVTYQPTTNQPPGQMILPPPGGVSSTGLIYPLASPAPITSPFGWRIHPISGDSRLHKGVDYGAPTGTPILAAARGRVDLAGELSGYGSTVVIRHNNDTLETLYAHMSQILVKEGQWVEQGTVIGLVGSTGYSTGPHLHFEVIQSTPDGWVAIDPVPQIDRSIALQNTPVIQPVATTNQTTIPGNQLTVTSLQPIGSPAIATPNLVTMSIGLNGVVETTDPVANLMSLGNRLVSFNATQNSSQMIKPVGVLAPLAFSPPMTPPLSSLIAPLVSERSSQTSVTPPTTPAQTASQDWVSFPAPTSLVIPEDPQPGNTTTSTTPTTNTVSQPITAATSGVLRRTQPSAVIPAKPQLPPQP